MVKNIIRIFLNSCLQVLFFFGSKTSNYSKYKLWINKVYSRWISLKFGGRKLWFKKPVNILRGTNYFNIGEDTSFGRLVVLTAWDKYGSVRYSPKILIGKNCNFGDYLHLTCINRIEIGDNCLTGRWVTISDNNHGRADINDIELSPQNRELYSKGEIKLGKNIWIGDKVTILGGVSIGDGAIIAANSVVTHSFPAYSVIGGNPAKIIKIFI